VLSYKILFKKFFILFVLILIITLISIYIDNLFYKYKSYKEEKFLCFLFNYIFINIKLKNLENKIKKRIDEYSKYWEFKKYSSNIKNIYNELLILYNEINTIKNWKRDNIFWNQEERINKIEKYYYFKKKYYEIEEKIKKNKNKLKYFT